MATPVLRPGEAPAVGAGLHQRRVLRNGYYPQIDGVGRSYYAAWETVGPTPAYVAQLPAEIRVAVRTAEPASSHAELVTTEKTYGNTLPTREQRLLSLARFWNTIHYFYGFPENIPHWDDVLSEFIPRFESAATWCDYVFTIARLASKTNDSHTWMPELRRELGSAPEVVVWPIDGQSVVRDVGPGVNGVGRGDIIVAVDGQPVEKRRKLLLEVASVATNNDVRRAHYHRRDHAYEDPPRPRPIPYRAARRTRHSGTAEQQQSGETRHVRGHKEPSTDQEMDCDNAKMIFLAYLIGFPSVTAYHASKE